VDAGRNALVERPVLTVQTKMRRTGRAAVRVNQAMEGAAPLVAVHNVDPRRATQPGLATRPLATATRDSSVSEENPALLARNDLLANNADGPRTGGVCALRDLIGQAKGILMQRFGIDNHAALHVLTEMATTATNRWQR
jgi:ANTAR domain-containing protein